MIKIRTITDITEAEILWRALSPQETIFDDWDFRYCFYKYQPYPLKFLVAEESGLAGSKTSVGLMSLQNNPEHGWEFFAEDPCEENRPFIKSGREEVIPLLYEAIPAPAAIYDISGSDDFTSALPLEDYKYVLPLSGFKDFFDFFASRLSARRRSGFRKDLAPYEAGETAVIFSRPDERLTDLELLFNLNNQNFSNESYLRVQEQSAWRDLLKLPLDWRLLVIKINGVKQAFYLNVLYNSHWYCLISGINRGFPGLGKYVVKANITEAIKAGAVSIDFGLGDCGWKHLWHFDRLPQYEFIKEI